MKLKRLLLPALALPFLSAFAAPRPNILLIVVDDMGFSDLGCTGSEIATPNLDTLAEQGLMFTNFTNNAKCETTRTSLLSGRYHTEVYAEGSKSVVTIPENLKLAGYETFMVGKWHIFDTPMSRGFERFFGFHEGATGHLFDEGGGRGSDSYRLNGKPYKFPKGFYTTDAFTDFTMQFIRARDADKPFFGYLAYNAPHYPLQAPEEEVLKYRGKYKAGWEALRKSRLARQKELRLFPADMPLPPPESDARDWADLSAEEQDEMDLRMATYAAMIDRLDQQIGRLVEFLKAENLYDDTLILFLSDNGACPFDRTKASTIKNNYAPWDSRSYYCYPMEWANACNTPLRKYKQNQNEGGIATPLIAHWPEGISVTGTRNHERGHLVDLHATFRELAGAEYPSTFNGNKIGPARGISLTPAFAGEARPAHSYLYYNYYKKYSALVVGDWKLVDEKHLYNLANDRVEQNDLVETHPEKFQSMLAKWKEVDAELNPKRRGKK